MDDRGIDLIVLDFAGVCTPSAAELSTIAPDATTTIRPGIARLATDARAMGITVVLLSNEISLGWPLSIDLFSLVDEVISCADNKIFKPDRRAFQRCLYLTGHSAPRTLVVDDDPDNVAVAASLGMHTIHFDVAQPEASLERITEAFS